jgi:hypothetical protein
LVNDVLPKVAKAVFKGMVVTYADVNTEFGEARRQYGIKHDIVPSLTVNRGGEYMPYPASEPLDEDSLVSFLTKIIKGEID